MKKWFFLSFLCLPLLSFCQNKTDCQYVYEKYVDSFDVKEYEIYSGFAYREHLTDSNTRIINFLSCLVTLANQGNEEAEAYFLKYLTDVYFFTKEKNISNHFFFDIVKPTLGKLNPNQNAFKTAMLFFSDNRSYSDELK